MALLEVENLNKSYFGVRVLRDVGFALGAGRVLGIVGENGSGKSTAMNILGGVVPKDSGRLRLDGRPYEPRSPRDARRSGIAFIHQELNLFENLSIEENLFISGFPRRAPLLPLIHRRAIRSRTRRLLETVDIPHGPATPVGDLSAGERQLVEIARALGAEARIVIFDEPTTSLTRRETRRLFAIIERLRSRGIAVIYISHVLGDVMRLCDEVAVLRDGAVVDRGPIGRMSADRMISAMVGRSIERLFPPRHTRSMDAPLLEVRGMTQPGIVKDIGFTLHRGEVLGVSGLMGSGRSEMARMLFGLDPFQSGRIELAGRPLRRPTPRRCMQRGMAFLTEDRRAEGLMMSATVLDNIALPSLRAYASRGLGVVRQRRLEREAAEIGGRVRLRAADIRRMLVKHLSGGNQQKAVLAKWLLRSPEVFILDEPTRGIDVGARHEVYKLINRLVADGAGVLFISSEMEELMGMCDRILVMSRGRIAAVHGREAFDSERILKSAMLHGLEEVGG